MLLGILICLYVLTGLQVTKSMTQITSEHTQWYSGWLITLGWPIVVVAVLVGMCVELGSVLVKMLNKSKEARNGGTTNKV